METFFFSFFSPFDLDLVSYQESDIMYQGGAAELAMQRHGYSSFRLAWAKASKGSLICNIPSIHSWPEPGLPEPEIRSLVMLKLPACSVCKQAPILAQPLLHSPAD
jgi:hypothetical protein